MDSHTIKVSKTAHYYSIGQPSKETTQVWVLLHGYGQLAERLLSKFSSLKTNNRFFLAPEGFSRFYWEGVSGHVAASWMTKKDRLHEIDDYSEYLNDLLDRYREYAPNAKINILGFS